MRFSICRLVLALALVACVWKQASAGKLEFNRDIRPILSDRCFLCHGPDASHREGGLRLDVRTAAIAPLDSGATAIVPNKVDASELVRRITATDASERMPPKKSGKTLSAAEIETLRQWVAEGAEYQPHWAFVPPQRPTPPVVQDKKQWAKNDIDRFVLSRLEAAGLEPAGEAPRESLLRRLAFDLTGLPPTIEETTLFLADASPQAYEKMVDRYLASQAYGEHLARFWLDLARYADTNGYQYDTERQQWVWRDWVIDAYNRNLPFDQFTIEQLAGDLIPNATPAQRLATGFNRNHGVTIEGGVIDEEYRVEYVMDRVVTTGATWLGLTVGCARCHDHKFDPLSQKEFYQFYAFFNQVQEKGLNGFEPTEAIASPLAEKRSQELAEELARLTLEPPAQSTADSQAFQAWIKELAASGAASWRILAPQAITSSGGSTLTKLDDNSVLAGKKNPAQDIYEITATLAGGPFTAVRLESLLHESLPGGGPGRHANSNFVLSEIEVTAAAKDGTQPQRVKLVRAEADYSQQDYEVAKAIDGVEGNSGWAVDGPTRKEPVTAMFVADAPFGHAEGTVLKVSLKHLGNFGAHGIGRVRLAVTSAPAERVALSGLSAEILAAAQKPAGERTAKELAELHKYYKEQVAGDKKKHAARIAELKKEQAAAYPATMIMRDLPTPRPTHVLNRGQYNEPKDVVTPNVPAVFPPLPPDANANRLALARWLVSPQHPLTARVTVNRYWQQLFGVGLVKTAEDFGLQGESPSHPELLDWLATEYLSNGWDTKQLLKTIVLSATYRQSSHVGRAAYERDPENRLLARGPRVRLDAEEVRDAALAVSGLLIPRVGGKSVYPYHPPGLWTEMNNRPGYSSEYVEGSGDDLYRRSLYTFWKRTVPAPMLKTLDAPDREICTVRRSRTNTPLQSLLLLNGPQFVEAARHLATRMLARELPSDEGRIGYGFAVALNRRATAEELNMLREFLVQERARFRANPAAAEALLKVGASPRDPKVDAVEHAAWTSLGRMLLNLDEFVSKG